MQIDLQSWDVELLEYLKDSVNAMPDSELIVRAKLMNELLQGLNQAKPNTVTVRQRVLGKMQLKNLPQPILELLRSATIADSLIKVLSEKALTEGIIALYERFDYNPVLASMLLDERESVRKFANLELCKGRKSLGKIKQNETFSYKFGPLIEVLRPILTGQPYFAPSQQIPNLNVSLQTLNQDQLEKQVRASNLFKQTYREKINMLMN